MQIRVDSFSQPAKGSIHHINLQKIFIVGKYCKNFLVI